MTLPWSHVDRMIPEYCDGRLSVEDAARVEAHLERCAACRSAADDFRFASALLTRLPVTKAPDSLWPGILAGLDARDKKSEKDSRFVFLSARRLALAATTVVAIGVAAYWYTSRSPAESWQVSATASNAGVDRVAAGQWLQTDASSRLRINVGSIGFVDVAPNSRVRLGTTRASEHRIELERGEISAQISAPPRLFFVDTPASTVVDLGCAYTMKVGDTGDGRLRVTLGWASLESNGRAALVPAGASCRTRPGAGPGTPCFDDASAALQQALDALDFQNGGRRALDTVLAESRVRDTLTLWHLLSRVDEIDRGRVADRITSLAPLPSGVSREKALELDPDTLTRWREELAWTW
jgi:hypothetical protein